MKRLYLLLIAFMALTMTANAQFQFGVEGGLNLNKLKLSDNLPDVSESNRAGFFVGPKVKFMLKGIGLGIDGAILYSNQTASFDINGSTESKHLHFIEVPVNIRYHIGLGSKAAIYIATGPQWNWNVGDKEWNVGKVVDATTNAVSNLSTTFESSSLSWNVGLGLILLKHLQVGATYNIPITKGGNILKTAVNTISDAIDSDVKNNTWQIRLGYFF